MPIEPALIDTAPATGTSRNFWSWLCLWKKTHLKSCTHWGLRRLQSPNYVCRCLKVRTKLRSAPNCYLACRRLDPLHLKFVVLSLPSFQNSSHYRLLVRSYLNTFLNVPSCPRPSLAPQIPKLLSPSQPPDSVDFLSCSDSNRQ